MLLCDQEADKQLLDIQLEIWNNLHAHLQGLPDNRQGKVFRKFPDTVQATTQVSNHAGIDMT